MQEQLNTLVNNTGHRVFSGAIANSIATMNEMGCWCYFDEDVGRGKGQPFDDLDGMCKTLANGYECAMRDAEDEGNTCTPWEVAYSPGTASGTTTLWASCQALNGGDNCASRACAVEGVFVENFLLTWSAETSSTKTTGTPTVSMSPLTAQSSHLTVVPQKKLAAVNTQTGNHTKLLEETVDAAEPGLSTPKLPAAATLLL